jgi:hypothetical protein
MYQFCLLKAFRAIVEFMTSHAFEISARDFTVAAVAVNFCMIRGRRLVGGILHDCN